MDSRGQSAYFHFQGDLRAKNARSIARIFHEVLLVIIFFQTKPQVKSLNVN